MRIGEVSAPHPDRADEPVAVGSVPVERPPVAGAGVDLDFSGLPKAELAVIDLSDEIEQVVLLINGEPAETLAEIAEPGAPTGAVRPVDMVASEAGTASADSADTDVETDAARSAVDTEASSVDAERSADLFAALRANPDDHVGSEATTVTSSVAVDAGEHSEAVRAQRDAIVGELNEQMHKRLKRALADEQNEVLAGITAAGCLTELVGDTDHHVTHYLGAMGQVAMLAFGAGVALIDETAERAGCGEMPAGAVEEIITNDIVVPLRLRLIELDAIDTDGPAAHIDAIRAFYRQRKTDHLGDVAAKLTTLLVNAGACEALPQGSLAPWVAAPSRG